MEAAEKIEHRCVSEANDLNTETESTMGKKCETSNLQTQIFMCVYIYIFIYILPTVFFFT